MGDLTHDTIGIATELFPLNVAYVAAYAKAMFGDRVDIRLFKYVPDLERAIESDAPDILALSNYPWNDRLGMLMFDLLRAKRPEALRVRGGPNFPHGAKDQKAFLSRRPLIDLHTHLDGEVPFKNFLDFVFAVGDIQKVRSTLSDQSIHGCVHLGPGGQAISYEGAPPRLEDLDAIPSPYLTGILDPFFDGKLTPIMQSNRGCPFRCTFCSDGTELVNKVTQFSLDRVKAEIQYIAERIPKNVTSIFMSDLNFGMLKRDGDICEKFAETRAKYGFPSDINQSTGKNSKERIIKNVERLSGAIAVAMSVQSLTPTVLKNIRRDNIKISDFLQLAPSLRKAKLATYSEVITSLPGETRESHIETLRALLNMGIDYVSPYSLLLVNGSEMATESQRKMWGFVTKFRVIPRDFTKLADGRTIVEVEEVVIETNTMPFHDYVDCRKIALLITVVNNMGFTALLQMMIQSNVMIADLLVRVKESLDAVAPVQGNAAHLLREFERETVEELWDSEDELHEFYSHAENFQGLVDGRYGANLIHTYRAKALATCIDEIVNHVFAAAREMFADRPDLSPLLDEIEEYCRARSFNLFGENRLEVAPEVEVDHDIAGWLADPERRPIAAFALPRRIPLRFRLTQEQYRVVEDGLDRYGHSDLGRGKLVTRINPDILWRVGVPVDRPEA